MCKDHPAHYSNLLRSHSTLRRVALLDRTTWCNHNKISCKGIAPRDPALLGALALRQIRILLRLWGFKESKIAKLA